MPNAKIVNKSKAMVRRAMPKVGRKGKGKGAKFPRVLSPKGKRY